ncbi:hypothetical protein ABZ569_34140 [Streptomyces albus]|uniref:hypothetical protein n=1 Tax=Streptomyces albus TaxID=1888 RepID=UPI0033C22582
MRTPPPAVPPRGLLRFDPKNREGKVLADLFRACKEIEENYGDWNGSEIVDCLTEVFDRLGLDVNGPADQVEADVIYVC